jgi:hypothetical protein
VSKTFYYPTTIEHEIPTNEQKKKPGEQNRANRAIMRFGETKIEVKDDKMIEPVVDTKQH